MKKNNILKKILATGMIAMTALFCTGLVAHAEESDNAYIEDYEKFMQAIQEAWDEAIQEASWVSATETTATQSKSKYQTKTTTTTQSKSRYQSSTKTTTTTQSKSRYQSSTNTTTATQDKLKYKDYFEKFDPEKTIHLTKSGKLLKCDDSKTWYFYHFDDELYNSVGCTGQILRGASTKDILCAEIQDNRYLHVTFIPSLSNAKLNDITIESNNNTTEKLNYTFLSAADVLYADLYDPSFRNGIYRITITYDDTEHAYIYLYINCASMTPKIMNFICVTLNSMIIQKTLTQ